MAALRRTDADLVAIQDAAADRRVPCDGRDRAVFVSADLACHLAVSAATGNTVLIDLYTGLTEALQRRVAEIDELDHDRAAVRGHDELAAAIATGDPEAARAAANGYLEAGRRLVEESR